MGCCVSLVSKVAKGQLCKNVWQLYQSSTVNDDFIGEFCFYEKIRKI